MGQPHSWPTCVGPTHILNAQIAAPLFRGFYQRSPHLLGDTATVISIRNRGHQPELTQISSIFSTIRKVLRGSVCKHEEMWQAPHQQKEIGYQSIDDTIVQLFISQASVLMTRVDRIQSESRKRRDRS
jgi:hypothetical protein